MQMAIRGVLRVLVMMLVVSLCYGAVLIVVLSCGAMWLSSNDIRQDTASDFGHFISQDQFAFFQPLQF